MYRAYDLSSTDSTVCDIERVPKKVMVFTGFVTPICASLEATAKKVAVRARPKACESVRDPSMRAASRVPVTCRAHVHSFAGAK